MFSKHGPQLWQRHKSENSPGTFYNKMSYFRPFITLYKYMFPRNPGQGSEYVALLES